MPNKTAEQIVHIRRKAWLQSASAHASIQGLTDDQQMLWLASDALEQAEADLQWAIVYADSIKTFSGRERLLLSLQLISISSLKQCVRLLRVLPPQTLALPLVMAQLWLMLYGTWWLLLGIHLNYWLVVPFIIANLVAMPLVQGIPDQLITALLDDAIELAESTHRKCICLQDKH